MLYHYLYRYYTHNHAPFSFNFYIYRVSMREVIQYDTIAFFMGCRRHSKDANRTSCRQIVNHSITRMFSLCGESPRVMGLQAGQITTCIKLLQGKLYLCTLKDPDIYTYKHTYNSTYEHTHTHAEAKYLLLFTVYASNATNKSLQEFTCYLMKKVN